MRHIYVLSTHVKSGQQTNSNDEKPQKWLPPDKTKAPPNKMKTRTNLKSAANPLRSLGLTARETEVLICIAQGKTNYEIGVILGACTGTICKHVEHILCKLGVKNRTSAAAIPLK